jgi:hypothetical protein
VWGISPIGNGGDGYWARDTSRVDVKRDAVAMVPAGASVSASYLLVPHLSHRHRIYEYPNPFTPKNWGIRDQDPDDPAVVQWIVVDTQTVSTEDRSDLDRLVATGEFRLRMNRGGLKVAQRVRAPSGNQGARR